MNIENEAKIAVESDWTVSCDKLRAISMKLRKQWLQLVNKHQKLFRNLNFGKRFSSETKLEFQTKCQKRNQKETEFKHNFSKCDQKLSFPVHFFKHSMFCPLKTQINLVGKNSNSVLLVVPLPGDTFEICRLKVNRLNMFLLVYSA
jgi:hypothetical protein